MENTALWVNRNDFRHTRVVSNDLAALQSWQIVVEIEKFALTANNVTYAASGDVFGYWQFYPTGEDPWGAVPVWGIARVVASSADELVVGERIYGFFPMSRYAILEPGNVVPSGFHDAASHRQVLPGLYNHYARLSGDSPDVAALEDARCLYFPLFITGFVIADLLSDNDFYAAKQIVVGSASSKTGFGAAAFLRQAGFQGAIIGLTAESNCTFCEALGFYDRVLPYSASASVDVQPTVFIDMSGDTDVRSSLHHRLGDDLIRSIVVGATHWEDFGTSTAPSSLPGVAPEVFFAPAQIEKRDNEWGAGVMIKRGYDASAALAMSLSDVLVVETHQGPEDLKTRWGQMLDNQISGQTGLMMSLSGETSSAS